MNVRNITLESQKCVAILIINQFEIYKLRNESDPGQRKDLVKEQQKIFSVRHRWGNILCGDKFD